MSTCPHVQIPMISRLESSQTTGRMICLMPWTSEGAEPAEAYVICVLQMLEASRNASCFAVNNILTVAFCSEWNRVSRSRFAVNGIELIGVPFMTRFVCTMPSCRGAVERHRLQLVEVRCPQHIHNPQGVNSFIQSSTVLCPRPTSSATDLK